MQRRFYLSLFLHPSVKIYYSDYYSGDDDDEMMCVCAYKILAIWNCRTDDMRVMCYRCGINKVKLVLVKYKSSCFQAFDYQF